MKNKKRLVVEEMTESFMEFYEEYEEMKGEISLSK
jgi:hypothetical protein